MCNSSRSNTSMSKDPTRFDLMSICHDKVCIDTNKYVCVDIGQRRSASTDGWMMQAASRHSDYEKKHVQRC